MDKKKNIVVIDDEVDLCRLIQDILQLNGLYSVSLCHSGEEGEKLCVRNPPDLVLLDFVLKKKKGDEVLKTLRQGQATRNIPVIMMSGLGEMVYFKNRDKWQWLPNNEAARKKGVVPFSLKWEKSPEQIAKDLGVQCFLSKPFSRDALVNAVEGTLNKSPRQPAVENLEV